MSAVLLGSLSAWWPEAILSAGGLLAIVAGAWSKPRRGALAVTWTALLAAAFALARAPVPAPTGLFFGLIACEPFTVAFRWLALGSVAVTVLLVMASRELPSESRGECLGLLLLIGVGLMLMAEANHLLMAYLAMELVSLSSYVLVGFLQEPRSAEASLKYLLFGAFSSGVMLFGFSLLFGLTGEFGFPELRQATAGLGGPLERALLVAVSFILAGLAFKVSMVPFHFWTPDAYEGAPVAVAAFLSIGPKAAGLALLARFMEVLSPSWPRLGPLLAALAIATMTLGNLAALVQTNVKRLFAYSTIGQVGYLLIGVAVNSRLGLEALVFYLIAYFFMNFGAFACIVAVVSGTGSESLDAFRGLSKRAPGLALLFTVFLLSLAGLPPLFGFFGKFLLFGSALAAANLWLAAAGVVNSAVALYYYVNLIRLMYLADPPSSRPVPLAASLRLALGMCVVATLVLGIFPGALVTFISAHSALNLL